jgi:hypothetical protein
MDFDASAQVDALAKLPPEPLKPAERSAWGWVPRITKAAVAGVAGSVADVVKGAAAADALTLGADPRARGAFTAEQLQAGQVEGQRQIDTGESMTSTLGDSFRQVQRDARPDPVTAGTAERLVFGVAEPMLKLIGGGMTLGPFGLGAASAEIGLQQSDDLRQQGVDFGTRTAVGALTAGVTAASVALPMMGPTLKSTAGLYVAGGPGGFMAQQAATSEILKRAGYAKIAEQFDPLDPVGLAMSALIPLPFAAYGARRVMKAGKAAEVKPEAPPVPEAPTVPREAVDAAMVHNLTLQRQAQTAVQERVRTLGPAEVLRAEVETRVADLQGQRAELLPDAGALAGRGEIRAAREELKALEQTRPADTPEALRERAKEIQAQERVSYKAALSTATKEIAGRVADHAAAVARVTDFIETNARAQQAVGRIAELDKSIALLQKEVEFLQTGTRTADPVEQPGMLAPASDAAPIPKPDPAPAALAETIASAQKELAAFRASGQTLDQYVASNELPPAVNNLLIGLAETLNNPGRTRTLLDMVGKADATADAANVTADAVEAVRTLTDADLTNTPADTIAAKPDPLMQSVTERVAAVEMTNPDMVVGTTESGNPITVRDELARIRKEAFEGTDIELGAKDADLVSVAANCALTNGG